VNKKAAGSSEPRLSRNKKAADLAGSAALVFYVIPSKTPSSSPRAYEYYDGNYEKPAVRQRKMDHKTLSKFDVTGFLQHSGTLVKEKPEVSSI